MIPCLQREIELSNPPHHIRVALAQHLFEHLRNFSDPAALTAEQKELATRTGPGTPAGKLLRCYWQPVALAEELSGDRPLTGVSVLG